MKATQAPTDARETGTPNWDARIGLALATLNWRPRCGLTALLAMKALQGYSIEALMAFERAYKAEPEGGAA